MAVYDEFTVCSLCEKPLDRPFMGLSFFIDGLPEELWAYGDSVVHMDCFDKWEHRRLFSHVSFNFYVRQWVNETGVLGYCLIKTEKYMLVCGGTSYEIDEMPNYAKVFFRDWDLCLHTFTDKWNTFIKGGYVQKLEGFSLISKQAIISIMDEIAEIIPDIQAFRKLYKDKVDKSS